MSNYPPHQPTPPPLPPDPPPIQQDQNNEFEDAAPMLEFTTPQRPTRRTSGTSPKTLRTYTYLGVRWGLPLAAIGLDFLIAMIAQSAPETGGLSALLAPISCLGCCGGVLWLMYGTWPSIRLTDFLMSQFVTTINCPSCGFALPAVGRWSSGEYTDHRERHIYTVRNPINGTVIGHTNCPQCDTTILLR